MTKTFSSKITYHNGFNYDELMHSEDPNMTTQETTKIMWQHITDVGIDPSTILSIVTVEIEPPTSNEPATEKDNTTMWAHIDAADISLDNLTVQEKDTALEPEAGQEDLDVPLDTDTQTHAY